MKTLTREDVEKISDKGLLPIADYTNLLSFLKTISPENLGEMINLAESGDTDKLNYLGYILGYIFMNEYEVDIFRDVDMKNMLTQFYRQCIAEACDRIGVWDASEEDRRLIPNDQPF